MQSGSVHPKQFERVLALTPAELAEYAFKRFADREELWALYQNGWALTAADDDNSAFFPVWPEAEFAAAYATDDWSGYEIRRIDLSEFVVDFLAEFRASRGSGRRFSDRRSR